MEVCNKHGSDKEGIHHEGSRARNHTFDIGNAKYAAKYQKSVDVIANHIQKEYKGGPKIAKAVKEVKLPTISIPGYPTAKAGLPLSIQETYSFGNKTSKRPKRESPCSLRTRSAHMPSFLDSAHRIRFPLLGKNYGSSLQKVYVPYKVVARR